MRQNNFFNKLEGLSIDDIQQVGIVDIEKGIGEMTPIRTFLFIILDDIILKLESVDQYSKLKIKYVDQIDFDFDFDEDMIPTKLSIAEIVLRDTFADNRIQSVELYGVDVHAHGSSVLCSSLCFILKNGQNIFFDPTFIFGINVGGIEQRQFWVDNLLDGSFEIIDKSIIEFN